MVHTIAYMRLPITFEYGTCDIRLLSLIASSRREISSNDIHGLLSKNNESLRMQDVNLFLKITKYFNIRIVNRVTLPNFF